jgi:hypothetical protein
MTVALRMFTKEGNSLQQGKYNLDFFLRGRNHPFDM